MQKTEFKLNNIFIIEDLSRFSDFISTGSLTSIFILADENTLKYCYPQLISHILHHHIIQVPPGEEYKTIQSCELIWKKLTEANADRNSLLINLGGGVIGDMGGFAAGCYKRGIKFINIPTTLLSMVDASVGGKTGIDFLGYKNQIGLFNEPEAVFIHTDFLKTLPERELISGFAEVIKHYLIADEGAFEKIRDPEFEIRHSLPEIVERNVKIKSHIVQQDPHEKGIRKALNFGHTIGHAVESCFLEDPDQELLHGEAVAIGMIAESFISVKKGLLSEQELKLISDLIMRHFELPTIIKSDLKQILKLIKQDKKNIKDQTQFTLLKGIGNFSINNNVEEELILESLGYYNSRLA